MELLVPQLLNGLVYGVLLFLMAAGLSLIFGLMRIPNLTHGSLFMMGAYFGVSLIAWGFGFWPAAILAAMGVALFGGLVAWFLLRQHAAAPAGHEAPAPAAESEPPPVGTVHG